MALVGQESPRKVVDEMSFGHSFVTWRFCSLYVSECIFIPYSQIRWLGPSYYQAVIVHCYATIPEYTGCPVKHRPAGVGSCLAELTHNSKCPVWWPGWRSTHTQPQIIV